MVSWWPATRLEWAFFSATAVQACVNITIQMVVLVYYLDWVNSVIYQVPLAYIISLTLSINSLGCLYQLILTLDAYRIKNHIQIFVLCAANICLSASTILQYGEVKSAQADALRNYDMHNTPFAKNDWGFWQHVSPALITCIAVSCLCSAITCILAIQLHREFSWSLYQHISPDLDIQNKYMVYQIYLVTLKYTPYFIFSFIIIYGIIDVHYREPEFSLTMAIIPATLIHLGLAVYFVRHEKRFAMFLILFLHVASMAYIISRLIVLNGRSQLANTLMKNEMMFYLVVALAFDSASFVIGSICFANFRKGLRPFLLGQIQRQSRAEQMEDDYYIQRLNYNIVPLSDRDGPRLDLD
ncbi:uncharacterized protein SETTUDRAFT_21723 [Exserohilum turcica Et28A]|uniref:Uncharacterized protein n=1 Tax=Exserohilum turcicum (strain 28A) TaxID=671987 RepID=R0K7T9_EXST2|nr:uncharacterized protein SETTUDRAFT_21723 [Exserohilum turcica Et28A]EOA84372.1 hypothetical protein SETTUDRAFT_21723 [Exserohilum turcica Et28A]